MSEVPRPGGIPAGMGASIAEIAARFGNDPSRLMDIGRAVHASRGHISEETAGEIAEALGVGRAMVRDALSFYAFFPRVPQGRSVIHLCNAVSERMSGADAVLEAFEASLGIRVGETTPCGTFTLKHTSCIGMSDQGPSALVDGVPLTRLTPGAVPQILEALRQGTAATDLPQARIASSVQKVGAVVLAPMEPGAALRKAIALEPDAVIAEITKSGLRGRGGAGFPTGMKWNFCRKAKGDAHYLICNADEGEPGTFKDRVLLTDHADLLFEGMAIGGYAIGAHEGLIYLRAEYAYLLPRLEGTLEARRKAGLLGKAILGKAGFDFDIRIQLGAGAYICGEESALIESLEGERGAPRHRPPFPVQRGYKDQPTTVNNVETLCCAARILERGAPWFDALGTKDSTGTKLLSVSGDCAKPGVYEIEYGMTVAEVLQMVGAAGAVPPIGDPIRPNKGLEIEGLEGVQAVQVGGPSGACIGPEAFGRRIAFEDLPTGGSIIIFGMERDVLALMCAFTEFFAEESCGWCVPCRVGTTLLVEKLKRILDGKGTASDLPALEELGRTVKYMSRCGLGQTAANPILTTLSAFPGLYRARLSSEEFVPVLDIEAAMRECCAAANRIPVHEEGVR